MCLLGCGESAADPGGCCCECGSDRGECCCCECQCDGVDLCDACDLCDLCEMPTEVWVIGFILTAPGLWIYGIITAANCKSNAPWIIIGGAILMGILSCCLLCLLPVKNSQNQHNHKNEIELHDIKQKSTINPEYERTATTDNEHNAKNSKKSSKKTCIYSTVTITWLCIVIPLIIISFLLLEYHPCFKTESSFPFSSSSSSSSSSSTNQATNEPTLKPTTPKIEWRAEMCEVIEVDKTKRDCWVGHYYEYKLLPSSISCSNLDENDSCIYDDSNGETDCESYGDHSVGELRQCWVKYINDECESCNCDNCDDDSRGDSPRSEVRRTCILFVYFLLSFVIMSIF